MVKAVKDQQEMKSVKATTEPVITEPTSSDILEDVMTEEEEQRAQELLDYKQALALEAQKEKEESIAKIEAEFIAKLKKIKSLSAIETIAPGCKIRFSNKYGKPVKIGEILIPTSGIEIKVLSENIDIINSILNSRIYINDKLIAHEIR